MQNNVQFTKVYTNNAFYFHVLRVYLQINTWKHLRKLLEFDKFGFFKDENSNITAIITDKGHAPKYMLQEMKCSCQRPNRAGLLCTGCVRAQNLDCYVLNFANVVVNVVTIAVKYAVLPPNALFTLVLRLRKS